jgi:hypothetical protein
MAGLNATSSGFSGRQPDYVQNIKLFMSSPAYGVVNWIYKKLPTGSTVITPYDKTKTVMIPDDLLVLGAIINPSDMNLKKNIKNIDSSDLIKLNPVTFQFKSDSHNKIHYGLIAQDVESIYPELVSNSPTGFKSVNYIELMPIMLAQI